MAIRILLAVVFRHTLTATQIGGRIVDPQPSLRSSRQVSSKRNADSEEVVAVTDGEDMETIPAGKPADVLHTAPDDDGARLRELVGAAKDALDVPVVVIGIDTDGGAGTLGTKLVEESPAKTAPDLELRRGRMRSNVVEEKFALELKPSAVTSTPEPQGPKPPSRRRAPLRSGRSRKVKRPKRHRAPCQSRGSAVTPGSSSFGGRVKPTEASK